MKNNPWIKLILVSLGGLVISLALLWSLQQIDRYTYYNNYSMQSEMSMPSIQQDMQMDNSEHNHM